MPSMKVLNKVPAINYINPTTIHDKTLIKLRMEGNFLNSINNIYKKLLANIILHDKKVDTFPLRSGIKQGHLFSPSYSTLYQKS